MNNRTILNSSEIKEYDDLLHIKNNKYFIIPDILTKNYTLYFTFENNQYKCVGSDNKLYTIRVPHYFYDNTLLIGKIFKDIFIIYDIHIFKSQSLRNNTYVHRYNLIKEELTNIILDQNINTINLQIATYYEMVNIDILKDKLKNTKFTIDKLLFIANNNIDPNYYFNLNNNINKFTIEKTNIIDVYNILENNTTIHVPNLEISLKYQKLFKNTNQLKLECIFNEKFNKWQLM